MKLTMEIIQHLNRDLTALGFGFVYIFRNEPNSPTAKIEVKCNGYHNWIDSSIINFTSDYYDWLNDWFMTNYKIKICYNNTGSTIWSDDFT